MPEIDHQRRIQTICLMILAFFTAGIALFLLRTMLVPFVLAVFFTFVLSPLIDFQVRRLRLPLALALVDTLMLAVLVLALLAGFVASSVAEMNDKQDLYITQFDKLLVEIDKFSEKLGYDLDRVVAGMKEKLRGVVGGVINAVTSLLSDGFLVLIFLLFLIVGRDVPQDGRPRGVLGKVETQIRSYLAVKVLTSTVTAALVYAILSIIGIDLALVFALFTFFLNFIPTIGSVIAVLLPLPVVVLTPGISHTEGILAIALPFAVQFSVGNVLEPRLMGRSLDLHPVVVLLALIFWGILWGFVGMLLSIPLTAACRILLEQSSYTKPVADAMAGRLPARATTENAE